jgi:hypothetical protein
MTNNMDGALAPSLWAAGEYDAVIEYLRQDCQTTLDIAYRALEVGELAWVSGKRDTPRWIVLDSDEDGFVLPTVRECLEWRVPDTSWMDEPKRRQQVMEWKL